MALALVLLVVYLAWVGYDGSAQMVEPRSPSADCRTPASAFSWPYQAINYGIASDAELGDFPDRMDCPRQGSGAGTQLTTSDGARIAGWYVPAADGGGPTGPTVVLAHGYGSNKSDMLAWAEPLHRSYNLVLFDFRNHGQSSAATTTVGVREELDLEAIVDWLESAKQPASIIVLGVSMGGGTAVNEAALDDRISALILDSTHATLANALQARLERSGYPLSLPAAWSILMAGLLRTGEDMSSADPVQAIERFGERPVLIVAGSDDDAIGSSDAQDLLAAALAGGSQAELKVCEGAGHAEAIQTCSTEYGSWVLDFLQRSLRAAR
jgi:pimeloyl-ACP methyl ester carboxylesterase